MDEQIKGLYIYARDGTETFKIKFIGSMAFGVIHEDTTDKRFLELYYPEYENQIKQLQAENERLKAENEILNKYYERAINGWQNLIDKLGRLCHDNQAIT